MMSLIGLYIKNIIKIKLIFLFICLFNILNAEDFIANTDSRIGDKQKSLDTIDLEISKLEKKLNQEITSLTTSKQKIEIIELELELERNNLLNDRDKKETHTKLLNKSNIILDSLNENLAKTTQNKKKVTQILQDIKQSSQIMNNKIQDLTDSIEFINNSISYTKNQLNVIKQLTKKMLKESISMIEPNEIEFLLEAHTWDVFILNSTLYTLLINKKEIEFKILLEKYEKMNSQYINDSIRKSQFLFDTQNLNNRLNNYTKQLNNFNAYQNILDDLIKDKKIFINKLLTMYENIGFKLSQSKSKIITLEKELKTINQKNNTSWEQQQKIKLELALKQESRQTIYNEILKLIETSKKLEGIKIVKLKGKLLWPINGDLITKFGKYTNPNTKVIIDYDLIEIQPKMTLEEKIIYLAKQISPHNPNKEIVQNFQIAAMNMKRGQRGFGNFGPKTTKVWKKYNKMNITSKKEPIYAIHDGIIESISFINPIVGVVVIIRHTDDYFSVYNGNIEVSVIEKSFVKSRTKIGTIKKQNILSFQLWKNKTPINPENWLIKK